MFPAFRRSACSASPDPGTSFFTSSGPAAAMSVGQALDPQVPVTLNFHPDRLARGRPILDQLAAEGRYLSQFVTGTSNGGLTAYPGGDRWRWESRIFGGAYDEAPARDRPVYGALNFRGKPTGGAPRFGSAHFRLVPCPVEWHGGFRLATAELRRHRGYRGQEFVDLGAEIAIVGHLDPQLIGEAARTGRYDPRDLKKVWHCLARFGSPEPLAMD
jgi:Protein of unknown function (DUF3626)